MIEHRLCYNTDMTVVMSLLLLLLLMMGGRTMRLAADILHVDPTHPAPCLAGLDGLPCDGQAVNLAMPQPSCFKEQCASVASVMAGFLVYLVAQYPDTVYTVWQDPAIHCILAARNGTAGHTILV
jgi:hypothetical protein